MKTIYKKNLFQKGFSFLYAIIGVVAVAVIGLVLFTKTFQRPNNTIEKISPSNTSANPKTFSEKFDKWENDSVIVYYPKVLKKGYELPGFIEFRDNPNQRYDNHLTADVVDEAKRLPYKAGLEEDVLTSNEACRQIQPSEIKYKKLTLVNSEYKEYRTYKGCLNLYSTDTKYNVIYYIVYQKPVSDPKTSIFQVRADYDSTNAVLGEDMKEAVSYFTPK